MVQSLNSNKGKTSFVRPTVLTRGGEGLPSRLWRAVRVKLKVGPLGQSLVEMAIAAPLLILMFLGVFEVGWALRGYMVLANANREGARFAVKNTVLDFSVKDPAQVGYHRVLTQTTASISRQLPLEFLGANPNATIIMSHFVVDTGLPCVSYSGGEPDIVNNRYVFAEDNCDCTAGDPSDPDGDGTPWFSRDDLVLHPDSPGFSYYSQTYGISQTTRLGNGNFAAAAESIRLKNNQLNCAILKTGTADELSVDNMIGIEMFYDQPQLLGAPIIANRFTDPIPFYAHTSMRITVGRDASEANTVGPVCQLFPITFAEQMIPPGQDPPFSLTLRQNSGGSDEFRWVVWNPAANGNVDYLVEASLNSRLSLHDFNDGGDTALSLDDRLTRFTGSTADTRLDDIVTALIGQSIQAPVHDGSGNLAHVALLGVTAAPDASGDDRELVVTFLGYQDEACEE